MHMQLKHKRVPEMSPDIPTDLRILFPKIDNGFELRGSWAQLKTLTPQLRLQTVTVLDHKIFTGRLPGKCILPE